MTTAEDRLRRAIAARTHAVEPSPDSLDQIQEKLMDTQRTDRNRSRLLIGLGAAAAVVAIVVAAVLVTQDDNDSTVDVADQTSTTAGSSTSSTTSAVAVPVEVDRSQTIYPTPSNALRYDDPKEVATGFAVEIVGFQAPIVGDFQQGDSRSGEVQIKPAVNGPVTTVLVRQLEDDHWWVIGATTDDIRLDSPESADTVRSPVRLQGEALAFEGHVNVSILADGTRKRVVGEGFVTGGGGPSAPFDDEIAFELDQITPTYGVIILYTTGGEDDRVWQATAIRVRFG